MVIFGHGFVGCAVGFDVGRGGLLCGVAYSACLYFFICCVSGQSKKNTAGKSGGDLVCG